VGVWSKRTILDALLDEAKDLEKQKAGRISQKEANSAAVSAAPEKNKKEEQIMIDTQGKPIEKEIPALLTTTSSALTVSYSLCLSTIVSSLFPVVCGCCCNNSSSSGEFFFSPCF
jgi:hypothetical protein